MESQPLWQLQPVPAGTRAWLLALVVVLPLAIVAGTTLFVANDPAPKQLIDNNPWLTNAVTIGATLLSCLAIQWFVGRSLHRHRLAIDGDGLQVTTTFFRRTLVWDDLQLPMARVVDLQEHTELKPLLKTAGVGLPGLRSGWYRLRNRHKALVAMTSGPRVLYLPTTRGYDLLLQPRQPQALLQRLRELAPASARR